MYLQCAFSHDNSSIDIVLTVAIGLGTLVSHFKSESTILFWFNQYIQSTNGSDMRAANLDS